MIHLKKTVYQVMFAGVFSFLSTQAQVKPAKSGGPDNLKYIDPKIGNIGWLLQPTRPTAQQPNQMIRMHPIRTDYLEDQISSFPLNVVSHRLGEVFSLMPTVRQVTPDSWKHKATYDHDLEITRPWYYTTYLIDDDISLEFVPGKKSGIFRIGFPKKATEKNLLLGVYNNGPSSWRFNGKDEIIGTETYHSNIKVFVYGRFTPSEKQGTMLEGALVRQSAIQGKQTGAWINFPASVDTVLFKYAISYVSEAQAKANFKSELDKATFEDTKARAERSWQQVMDKISVEGGTEAQRRSFFSAYYRCNERMVDISEGQQFYSGFDSKVHSSQRTFYVDDWTWDTYLALHPLRTILNPKQEMDMLNSYVAMYEQSGWMPTFPVLFGDHACMNGFHSSIMFLDAYRKGLRGFDIQKAYSGMKKNATEATMLPWRNGPKTQLDDFYYQKGYFPALRPGEKEMVSTVDSFEKRQAVAVTLGASYDDWAVGELAKDLGKIEEGKLFSSRASNYKNLWYGSKQMFFPKDQNGQWINIDPKIDGGKGGREYYDENNGWTYIWQAQHDINGLVDLMGGKGPFEARLDQLYREGLGRSKSDFWFTFPDATGLVGQYSMGNEPSFHIPYLYNYTNAPWKTQKQIRLLLDVWFKDNVFGIPGDEDGGGMSAFVVFSSMGFYPITPGLPVYTIGSPVFSKVTLDLDNGKKFTVRANRCSVMNKYIQSAKFNGVTLNKPWFTHEQLMDGGTLELEMGPKPNKNWGI